ncbi:hypothetical protein LguiA_018831 [Lonicera macranthoides]
MVRFSNNLIGILNTVTFLLSIPILVTGIWLSKQDSTECSRFLEKPIIALGVFLMLVSIAGIIGSCCRVSCLLWFYLLVMFLLILLLFCFTIFAFVVTNKGAGRVVSGRGYKEYRVGDYSNWLQKRVGNEGNWRKIKSCLQDSKICQKLTDNNETIYEDVYTEKLSAVQIFDSVCAEEFRLEALTLKMHIKRLFSLNFLDACLRLLLYFLLRRLVSEEGFCLFSMANDEGELRILAMHAGRLPRYHQHNDEVDYEEELEDRQPALNNNNHGREEYYRTKADSGCCKPADACNFTYVTSTNWTKTGSSTQTNPDCSTWENDPSVLCYDCQSCKAGMLDNIKSDWKKVAVVNIIFLVFLIIVYSIGCCAFRNNREDNSWK